MDDKSCVYVDFQRKYLSDLQGFLVPIAHVSDDGEESIGSGVWLSVRDRHFVASAKHCLENHPRVMVGECSVFNNQIAVKRPLRILRQGLHDTLDIGYLEIEATGSKEIQWEQLCDDRVRDGLLHVIGYPIVLREKNLARRAIDLWCAVFSTVIMEDTHEYLQLDFPKEGKRFDPSTGQMETSRFPETPVGFSGGGCFGVVSRKAGELEVIEYKLLAIQSCWLEGGRWVRAVPIRHLCDLLKRDGYAE